MSRTYRKKEIKWDSPRENQVKRQKRRFIDELDEELKRYRSPLYAWEQDREKAGE